MPAFPVAFDVPRPRAPVFPLPPSKYGNCHHSDYRPGDPDRFGGRFDIVLIESACWYPKQNRGMPEFGGAGTGPGNTHNELRIPLADEVLLRKRKRGEDGELLKKKIHKRNSGNPNPNGNPDGELGYRGMIRFLVESITNAFPRWVERGGTDVVKRDKPSDPFAATCKTRCIGGGREKCKGGKFVVQSRPITSLLMDPRMRQTLVDLHEDFGKLGKTIQVDPNTMVNNAVPKQKQEKLKAGLRMVVKKEGKGGDRVDNFFYVVDSAEADDYMVSW